MTSSAYGFNLQFAWIDEALRSRWEPFIAHDQEMSQFVPKPRSHFVECRDAMAAELKCLSPDISIDDLTSSIDQSLDLVSSHPMQFRQQFHSRLMGEYVTVVMLSQPLCEALINAVLAIGLMKAGMTELFDLLEHVEFCKKWRIGPKSFLPSYAFPTGEALFQTLKTLTKVRNGLVHHKIELEVDGEKVLKGSQLYPMSIDEITKWMRRFFSLPYDLAKFMMGEWRKCPPILLNKGNIERAAVHKKRK